VRCADVQERSHIVGAHPQTPQMISHSPLTLAQPILKHLQHQRHGPVVLLDTLTNGTVSFTNSPARTYVGDGFTNT
jgi:hypothetical protein